MLGSPYEWSPDWDGGGAYHYLAGPKTPGEVDRSGLIGRMIVGDVAWNAYPPCGGGLSLEARSVDSYGSSDPAFFDDLVDEDPAQLAVGCGEDPVKLYDLFVSYRRKDSGAVLPFVDAFERLGLKVWIDQREIADFASITDEIRAGLASSKALLAWYSLDYPRSRPCQMELTAAYLAAGRAGDPRQRVLVLNPERDALHVLPIQLADQQHPPLESPDDLARRVATRVRDLEGTLGAILPVDLPPQHCHNLAPAVRFVGRLQDLWRLHSALHGSDAAIVSSNPTGGPAHLIGMGGVGKTMLAEEYALRFAAAYPGGIFWLRAQAHDPTTPAQDAISAEALREDQFRNAAISLGVRVQGISPQEIDAAVAARLRTAAAPYLWVVDDLAPDLGHQIARRWWAPSPTGRTLVTTQSREYAAVGSPVDLDVLPLDDACALLTARRRPSDAGEEAAARGIAADLGCHPLALEVAGAALQSEEGMSTFAAFRVALANPRADELEIAADPAIVGMLPTGHEPSVVGTLMRSVRSLGSEGRDLLLLAVVLAAAPIPMSLLRATFAIVDALDQARAVQRARLALAQTRQASLARDVEGGAYSVHLLVARAMRFHERNAGTGRSSRLRAAAVLALGSALPAVNDIRAHGALALEVLHARRICASGIDDAPTADLGFWVARHDFERGAFHVARLLQQQVVAVSRREWGPTDLRTLTAMSNLAQSLMGIGEFKAAEDLEAGLFEARERQLGMVHPDTIAAMNNLAGARFAQGDVSGARKLQERILSVCEREWGTVDSRTAGARMNLAGSLQAEGDLPGARVLLEEALEGWRATLRPDHRDTLMAMSNLGLLLHAEGDYPGARALQEPALEGSRRVLGDRHSQTSLHAWNLFMTLVALEDSGAMVRVLVGDLLWMEAADPTSLTAEQREIRLMLGKWRDDHR